MSQTEEGIAFPLWHRIRAAVLVEVEVEEVGEGEDVAVVEDAAEES